MSETQGAPINLLESSTFTTKVKCQLPAQGTDTWREFEFSATFRVLSEDEQEALPISVSVRDVLREVLVGTDVPSAKLPDGTELSGVDVVIANQFTSDAAHTKYRLQTTKNGRDLQSAAAMSSVSKGNSKRSPRR